MDYSRVFHRQYQNHHLVRTFLLVIQNCIGHLGGHLGVKNLINSKIL